jgi:hypothetical protein
MLGRRGRIFIIKGLYGQIRSKTNYTIEKSLELYKKYLMDVLFINMIFQNW